MAFAAKRAAVLEVERQLEEKNAEIAWEKLSSWEKVKQGIFMAIQKANSPSITLSPAVISLVLIIIAQAAGGLWWASSFSSSTNKELERKDEQIKELKSDVATFKVYMDTSREKQVKQEAQIETLEKQQQQTNLLLQMKGVK